MNIEMYVNVEIVIVIQKQKTQPMKTTVLSLMTPANVKAVND